MSNHQKITITTTEYKKMNKQQSMVFVTHRNLSMYESDFTESPGVLPPFNLFIFLVFITDTNLE